VKQGSNIKNFNIIHFAYSRGIPVADCQASAWISQGSRFDPQLGISAAVVLLGKKLYSHCLSHPAIKPGKYCTLCVIRAQLKSSFIADVFITVKNTHIYIYFFCFIAQGQRVQWVMAVCFFVTSKRLLPRFIVENGDMYQKNLTHHWIFLFMANTMVQIATLYIIAFASYVHQFL